eukprot:2526295-Amphidinium_carterae.1
MERQNQHPKFKQLKWCLTCVGTFVRGLLHDVQQPPKTPRKSGSRTGSYREFDRAHTAFVLRVRQLKTKRSLVIVLGRAKTRLRVAQPSSFRAQTNGK